MKLSAKDFSRAYNEKALKIAFIGMSNIGKSFTAKRLADAYDFELIDIDHNIQRQLGKDSMEDFAAWQGQPYEPGYAAREAQSITLETQAVLEAIESVSGNVILDTAGSVIYTSQKALELLKSNFHIVYIKADDADLKRLETIYYDSPKPLVWADHFKPNPDLNDAENIASCYPNLLAARSKEYQALADTVLSSEFIINHDAEEIFEALAGL